MTNAAGPGRPGRRLVAAAMAAIAVVIAVFVAVAWRYHTVLIAEAQERTAQLSFLLSEQAARTFEAVDFTLRGFEPLLETDAPVQDAVLDGLLRKRVSELSFVQTIRVIDSDGRVVLSSDPAARGTSDPGCRTALTAPAAALAIGCTAGDVGPAGQAAIAVARRLTSRGGQFGGAIVADVDPAYFSRFFADLDLGRHAVVTLTEQNGHVLLAAMHPLVTSSPPLRPTLVPPTEKVRLGELQRSWQGQITSVHATEGYPLAVLVGIDRSDVERRWWQVMVPAFMLTAATAALLLALAWNVERNRAERGRALQRAVVAQKLEAMGQMTASVAHDFRNVLTALQGSLRLLGKRGPDPAVLREVDSTLARGNAMVDRLLGFSKRQELRLEPHDVNGLLQDLAATLRHIAGAGVTVVFDLAANIPPCRIDRVQFDATLMNLVVNARQAMPAGGTVTIGSRSVASGGVEVSVRDTGCGIDAVTLKRVFEPFFTTKAETGTGLGLAQVQGFMQQIAGSVAIDSTVGVGTTVKLRLPGAPVEAKAEAALTLDSV